MKTKILPVFSSTSSMHRVFGDHQPHTDITTQDNILGPVLLKQSSPDGDVTIRVRSWFWKPTYAPLGVVTSRFECYLDGVLVDYTCERNLIVKTLRWLTEHGQVNKISI